MNKMQFITFHTNVSLIPNVSILDSIIQIDLLEFMMELDINYFLEVKNMIPSTTGLDILEA